MLRAHSRRNAIESSGWHRVAELIFDDFFFLPLCGFAAFLEEILLIDFAKFFSNNFGDIFVYFDKYIYI